MINFLITMLAIVNPIGIVPIWKELTSDEEKAVRKKLAFLITGTALVILLIFLNTGPFLLRFFSIDMPVFKIAGGILLLLTALSMVEGLDSVFPGWLDGSSAIEANKVKEK